MLRYVHFDPITGITHANGELSLEDTIKVVHEAASEVSTSMCVALLKALGRHLNLSFFDLSFPSQSEFMRKLRALTEKIYPELFYRNTTLYWLPKNVQGIEARKKVLEAMEKELQATLEAQSNTVKS
jgi:hypothetical protein